MTISEKIILLRKQKGLSQEQLAEQLDVSRQSVYKWETGTSLPDLDKLKKMASYFEISFDLLLNDDLDISMSSATSSGKNSYNSKKHSFRPVYNSGEILGWFQGDIEARKFNRKRSRNFLENFDYCDNLVSTRLERSGFTQQLRLAGNVAVYFAAHPEKKLFTIAFKGKSQFICPFENFIDFRFSTDAVNKRYTGEQFFSGVGFGGNGNNTFIGSTSEYSVAQSGIYHLVISYFTTEGEIALYKITIDCDCCYLQDEFPGEYYVSLLNDVSATTLKNLTEMQTRLQGFSIVGKQISSGAMAAETYNLEKMLAAQNDNVYYPTLIENQVPKPSNFRKKRAIIITILFAIFVIIVSYLCSKAGDSYIEFVPMY